jgi:hypothetical protein
MRRRLKTLEPSHLSPDVAPTDYHYLPARKKYLSGHELLDDSEMKTIATQLLTTENTDFYQKEIEKLTPGHRKCQFRQGLDEKVTNSCTFQFEVFVLELNVNKPKYVYSKHIFLISLL